jgi:hypothetical protein
MDITSLKMQDFRLAFFLSLCGASTIHHSEELSTFYSNHPQTITSNP